MKTPILAFLCALSTAFLASGQVPSLINYQGRLTDANGAAVTGSKNFSINIFDAATGGNLLYSETIGAVTLDSNGVYSFQFGSAGTSDTQVTETIGTTAGSTLTYTKTLSNTPVVANSITVTDGTNSWSQSVGNPGVAATATASRVSGFVIGAEITNGGSGYTSAPLVTITGSGSGATATATLTGGVVTEITITSAGSGYSGGATITIAPPVIPFRVDYTGGAITATYSTAAAAGRNITATYRYGTSGITGALSSGAEHWMTVSVDSVVQGSRQRVLTVPFAMNAGAADHATTATTSTTVVNGAITAEKLAPGTASASLQSDGFAGVASGGVVMSVGKNDELANAGYVRIGETRLNELWKRRAAGPSERAVHTAVWTGSEMIVWGGTNSSSNSTLLNTGGIYNPSSDTWRATSTTNAPAARNFHPAIWTGSQMIVWGGYAGNNTTHNDGGRYDPQTDTWSSISPIGAPSGRDRHTAVWTGTEMIVWGGSGIGGIASNAGAYNPQTDAWRSLSITNAPSGRRDHSAIWTGSRMIIWGGSNDSGFLNTGGSYDPTTDTWTSISTNGAPAGRTGHTAVWTGTQMLVWGGSNSLTAGTNSNYFADGGRYDIASNTWTSISTSGAPLARAVHSAIWTGSDMIVWGGILVNTPYSSGGSYNPISNSWTSLTTTSDPSARGVHTAVWTGGEMVVFGGFNSIYNCLKDVSTYMPPNLMFLYQKP